MIGFSSRNGTISLFLPDKSTTNYLSRLMDTNLIISTYGNSP
ncbi:hypothetical protein MC7420_2863 [Coleofasciculus chthonoplastes PCC 7420]|uniref:Uncharacterized protein n=1 Tax=Coleofasciculus chthonoplastes PCC 7420 TaxID=118168 RepID=B4VKF7_9CYAN|nr:hypothetical protein MC7420_2863 [Coleofasciculus chthonoplastes PCC 7420]